MSINLEEFRTGQFRIPFSSQDELPSCCFTCPYLLAEEATVCFCESFYYFCAYYWPDKLTQLEPPCLKEA